MTDTKYVFVTGGVLSGLGKGIVAASIGKILQTKDSKVVISKQDGYFNFDSGTHSPDTH